MTLSLDDPKLEALNRLIEENLRIGRGEPPIYIDVSNNIDRILSKQNHVIFGRRGSGKSTLLLKAKSKAEELGFLCIYLDSELIKENPYPDLLISVLIDVFEYLSVILTHKNKQKLYFFSRLFPFFKNNIYNKIKSTIVELEKLKSEPQNYEVARKKTSTQEKKVHANAGFDIEKAKIGGDIDNTRVSSIEEATEIKVEKIALLQQNLGAYHSLIIEILKELGKDMMLFIDDFYFTARENQPDVIDYLHRLCKGTHMYLKIGTIRYRTNLYRTSRQNGRTIGVELDNDIFPIDLDYTLEDLNILSTFLDQILRIFAERVDIQINDLDTLFTEGGKKLLHLASGGVPRDFLNLFLRSQSIARKLMLKKLEKQRVVGEAARQYLNEVKKQNFTEDSLGDSGQLEKIIERICKFTIEDKKKTVMLIDQEENRKHPDEYDKLKQLMDLRFMHLVDSHTSATYGGRKRYEAYMVDAGLWASPRIPGLVEVDFDKRDASGRKDELRNCPKFRLS